VWTSSFDLFNISFCVEVIVRSSIIDLLTNPFFLYISFFIVGEPKMAKVSKFDLFSIRSLSLYLTLSPPPPPLKDYWLVANSVSAVNCFP
jgi:hypothetical protein